MPKIRSAGASLADALKHLRVFQARLNNTSDHQPYSHKITEATMLIQEVSKAFPIEENNNLELISNEQINIAMSLIQKEQIKNKPKIDHVAILRAICTATTDKEVLKLANEYKLSREQLQAIAKKAPNTHIGKLFTQVRSKPAFKIPAAIQQIEEDEQQYDGTIDSEDVIPDDIRQVLGE